MQSMFKWGLTNNLKDFMVHWFVRTSDVVTGVVSRFEHLANYCVRWMSLSDFQFRRFTKVVAHCLHVRNV